MRRIGCFLPLTLENSQMLENTYNGLKLNNVVTGFVDVLSMTVFVGDVLVKNSDIPIFQ